MSVHSDVTLSPSEVARQAIDELRSELAGVTRDYSIAVRTGNGNIQELQGRMGDLQDAISFAVGAQAVFSPTAVVVPERLGRAPSNLPCLQWEGYVWKPSAPAFPTLDDCLIKFEDVVYGDGWDINQSWPRFLPMLLSPEHRSWFAVNLEPFTDKPWSFARSRLVEDLDVNEADRVADFTDQLMNIRMRTSETVALFTARFEKLRRDAKAPDNFVMVTKYIDALLPDLQDRVYTARAGLPAHQKESIAGISSLALSLEKGVNKARSRKAHHSSSSGSSSASSGGSSSKDGKRRRVEKTSYFCELHGNGGHATKDCKVRAKVLAQSSSVGASASMHNPFRASSSAGSSSGSSGSTSGTLSGPVSGPSLPSSSSGASGRGNPCRKCGAPWQHGHACVTRAIRSSRVVEPASAPPTAKKEDDDDLDIVMGDLDLAVGPCSD